MVRLQHVRSYFGSRHRRTIKPFESYSMELQPLYTPVRVFAFLYDRAKLKHLELLFVIRFLFHRPSQRVALLEPPLQHTTVRFINENGLDSGYTGGWVFELCDNAETRWR